MTKSAHMVTQGKRKNKQANHKRKDQISVRPQSVLMNIKIC